MENSVPAKCDHPRVENQAELRPARCAAAGPAVNASGIRREAIGNASGLRWVFSHRFLRCVDQLKQIGIVSGALGQTQKQVAGGV